MEGGVIILSETDTKENIYKYKGRRGRGITPIPLGL